MLDLEYDLKAICRRNRDGSHMTQAQREQRLRMIARDLHALGYRNMRAGSLKPKHVPALVADWQQRGLCAGTIKNRNAALFGAAQNGLMKSRSLRPRRRVAAHPRRR